ncbi:SGNH/GDSL hydrolase family protein [bacterium]|nr:SGNH/GDSL hydrolase family protein [bacterium]
MVRSVLKPLFYFLFVTAVTLLCSEAILRLFDPIGIEYVFEARRYFKIMQSDPVYAYKHRAGIDEKFQGVRVRTNSEGFRGAEFSVQKPPGTSRVLLLGDSVVFGWGAPESSTLGVQLEEQLRASSSSPVEVISAGVGSWNTRTEAEWFRARGVDYEPDLLALVVVGNDLDLKSRGNTGVPREDLQLEYSSSVPEFFRSPPKWYRELSGSSYLVAAIQRFFTVRMMGEKLRAQLASAPVKQEINLAVDLLVTECKKRQIPLYVFLFGSAATETSKAFQQLYLDAFSRHGVSVKRFPEELYQSKHKNSAVDPHPNHSGLSIMSQVVADKIRDRWKTEPQE